MTKHSHPFQLIKYHIQYITFSMHMKHTIQKHLQSYSLNTSVKNLSNLVSPLLAHDRHLVLSLMKVEMCG